MNALEHLEKKEIYKGLGIDKGAMLRMEKSKRDTMERIKLVFHQECIGTLGEFPRNQQVDWELEKCANALLDGKK